MTVRFEYPNKFTFSKIKAKTDSVRPIVNGLANYVFRFKNSFVGISINPSTGIITVGSKTVPGNYVLEIDCVDSVNNKNIYSTKHVVFVRDPNENFPGDDEFTDDCDYKSEKNKNDRENKNDKNDRYETDDMSEKNYKRNKTKLNKSHRRTDGSVKSKNKLQEYFSNAIENNKNIWVVSIIFTLLLTLVKMIS